MLAFIYSFILIFAEGGSGGGWWAKASPYLNYPGFEAWKFINLTIFIAIIVYLLKKPLSEAFKAKREAIRAELIRAEEEKQAALAKLTTAEAKLARIDTESEEILEKAKLEAKEEKARIGREADEEVKRLRAQAASEIDRKAQQVRAELRRFSAEESVRLAEEKIKQNINAAKDAELVKAGLQSIGGVN
ncbi:MAG: ATP synthase F0 subunit B [Acidobacteria bacterium]|nr:ATP synthase F0 subunit B [Acidobacteriota bacterium]